LQLHSLRLTSFYKETFQGLYTTEVLCKSPDEYIGAVLAL